MNAMTTLSTMISSARCRDARRSRLASLMGIAALTTLAGSTVAATINVPADFGTIQQAIVASAPGDEILVAPGTYFERIDFLGKAITVRGTGGPAVTTIDGTGQTPPVVALITGETSGAILEGFTITNGSGSRGAGMRVGSTTTGASPVVRNVIFLNNSADNSGSTLRRGGAVSIQSPSSGPLSQPLFQNVAFTGNTSGGTTRTLARGGAVDVASGLPTFDLCTFTNNRTIGTTSGGTVNGGAINVEVGGAIITSSTFTGNAAQGSSSGGVGGAISITAGTVTITGTTFNGNTSTADGATIAQQGGTVTVTGGAITNAAGGGGSAFRSTAGPSSFNGVSFTGNTSTTNNIIQFNNPTAGLPGPFTFNNCTIVTTTGQTAVRMAAVGAEIIFNGGSFSNATGNGNGINASDPASTLRISGTSFSGYGTAATAAGTGVVTNATFTGNGIGARFGGSTTSTAAHSLTGSTFTANGTAATNTGGTLTISGTSISGVGGPVNTIGLNASSSTVVATGLGVTGTTAGAVLGNDANITLNGGSIDANRRSGSSGVVNVAGGSLTMTGASITGTTAGAALSTSDAVVTITGSEFARNLGVATVLVSSAGPTFTITGSQFRSNQNLSDVVAFSLDPAVVATVEGCSFESNTTSASALAFSDGNSTVRGGGFFGNTFGGGAGLVVLSGGSLGLIGNTMIGNTAPVAGSLINVDTASGGLTLVNGLIAGNGVPTSVVNASTGTLTVVNSTLVNNAGPAVEVNTTDAVSVANSILRGNTGGQIVDSGSIATVNASNVQGGWSGAGTGNIDAVQAFVDADGADNVANTADDNYRLVAGSPGINTGNSALVPAGITTDLAGSARIVGSAVDQGAFEFSSSVVACTPSDIAGPGPSVGADGELTADDIILFISWFTSSDTRADIASPGPVAGPDGELTADDIILFVNRFTTGC